MHNMQYCTREHFRTNSAPFFYLQNGLQETTRSDMDMVDTLACARKKDDAPTIFCLKSRRMRMTSTQIILLLSFSVKNTFLVFTRQHFSTIIL